MKFGFGVLKICSGDFGSYFRIPYDFLRRFHPSAPPRSSLGAIWETRICHTRTRTRTQTHKLFGDSKRKPDSVVDARMDSNQAIICAPSTLCARWASREFWGLSELEAASPRTQRPRASSSGACKCTQRGHIGGIFGEKPGGTKIEKRRKNIEPLRKLRNT